MLIILSLGQRRVSGEDIAHAVAMEVVFSLYQGLLFTAWQVPSFPRACLGSTPVSRGLFPCRTFSFLSTCYVS